MIVPMLGNKDNIKSGRILGLGEGIYQVEAGIGQKGIAVHLNDASMARYLADLFKRAAEILEQDDRHVPPKL